MTRHSWIVAGAVVLFAHAAAAIEIDPRCRNMHDKVGCTCAMQNGGGIHPFKRVWFSRYARQPVNEAFVLCAMEQAALEARVSPDLPIVNPSHLDAYMNK